MIWWWWWWLKSLLLLIPSRHPIDVVCARVELILLCYKNIAMNMYMTFLLIAGCYVLMLSYPLVNVHRKNKIAEYSKKEETASSNLQRTNFLLTCAFQSTGQARGGWFTVTEIPKFSTPPALRHSSKCQWSPSHPLPWKPRTWSKFPKKKHVWNSRHHQD